MSHTDTSRAKRLAIVIPLRISLIYVILGSLLILLSDNLVGNLAADTCTLSRIGIVKGSLFVAVTGFILFVLLRRDILHLQRSRDELSLAREHHRDLEESVNSIIMRVDPSGRILFMNEFGLRFFGFTREGITGRHLLETIVPTIDSAGRDLSEFVRDALADPEQFAFRENENMRENGERVHVAWINRGIRDAAGVLVEILCVGNDVTEHNLAEERLRETNQYLENILDNSPDAICIADTSGRFVRFNRVAEDLFGYGPDVIRESTLQDLCTDPSQFPSIESDLAEKGVVRARQVVVRRADGSHIPVEISISNLRKPGGAAVGTITIARDISEIKKANALLREEINERLKAEEASRRSENTYHAVFQHTGSATVILEESGILSTVNPEFERLSGFTREEVEGKMTWEAFISPEDLERLRHYHRARRSDPDNVPNKYEFTFRNRHNRQRTVLSSVGMIPGTGRTVASLVDVTDLRRLEEELFKADKLESIGILAGGIAHDFNNILTAVMGNISLARMGTPAGSPTIPRLDEAERAAMRARDLTSQLLTFSRGGAPILKTTSIVDVVRESAKFALRGSNVRCEFEAPEKPWLIDADAGQISRVIGNMVMNAKQSMPQGGVVSIRIANIVIDAPHDPPLPHGKVLRISIGDQGTGIESAHLAKVFDPFFTTRSGGSGLGLATCYSIVHKHGGAIGVDSEVGAGTTFHIHLPASEEQTVTPRAPSGESPTGQGKILVMDDEAMIRDTLVRMLRLLGYRAESAPDGRQTLEMYAAAARRGSPYEAVILDLTIPGGMGGAETNVELHKMDPGVLTIASSGYSNDPIMANCREHGFFGVIEKPYRVQDLADVLHSVLRQRQTAESHFTESSSNPDLR